MKSVSHGPVKGLFLVNSSTDVECQLNKNAILCAPNAQIIFVGDEIANWILGNDLETVVLRCIQNADHHFIDDVTYGTTICGGLSLDHVDSTERHIRSFGDGLPLIGQL